MSRRKYRPGLLAHEQEHHQHVVTAIFKVIIGVNVDLNNLASHQILHNLTVWMRSNGALACTDF